MCVCEHACNATEGQENSMIQNENELVFHCQNNTNNMKVFAAVCWKMGKKIHSFTKDLATFSSTLFALSLGKYMPVWLAQGSLTDGTMQTHECIITLQAI